MSDQTRIDDLQRAFAQATEQYRSLRADVDAYGAELDRLRGELEALTGTTAPRNQTASMADPLGAAAPEPVPEDDHPNVLADDGVSDADKHDTALCDHLERVAQQITDKNVGIDPGDIAFMTKARKVLETAKDARPQRLLDLLRFVDQAAQAYPSSHYAPLHDSLDQARVLLDACLADQATLVQTATVADDADGPTLPVKRPMILQSGLRDPGGSVVLPPRAVKVGSPPAPIIGLAWRLLEEAFQRLLTAYGKGLKKDISYGVEQIFAAIDGGSPVAADAELGRAVLNLHTRWMESVETPAAKAMLAHLKTEAGWSPKSLALDTKFDPESLSPKLYDRVAKHDTGKQAWTVVGIRQIGLVDGQGLPVQQCLAYVAS